MHSPWCVGSEYEATLCNTDVSMRNLQGQNKEYTNHMRKIPYAPISFREALCVFMSYIIKPFFGVCGQVSHKPACSASEANSSLGVLDLASIGIIQSNLNSKQ